MRRRVCADSPTPSSGPTQRRFRTRPFELTALLWPPPSYRDRLPLPPAEEPWVTPGRTRPRWLKIRGFVYWTDLADFDARNMAVDRSYGARVIATILCHLPVSGTFIDVGAHVGGITLPAASHVGPEGRVLAIEPNPNTAT